MFTSSKTTVSRTRSRLRLAQTWISIMFNLHNLPVLESNSHFGVQNRKIIVSTWQRLQSNPKMNAWIRWWLFVMIRFGNWRPQANRNIQICLHRTKQLHFHTFRMYPNKDTLHIHFDSLLVDGLNFSKYIEIADCYMKYDDRVYWK